MNRWRGLLSLVLLLLMLACTRSVSANVIITLTGLDGSSTSTTALAGGTFDMLVRMTADANEVMNGAAYRLKDVSALPNSQMRIFDRDSPTFATTLITTYTADDATVENATNGLLSPVNANDLGGLMTTSQTGGTIVLGRIRMLLNAAAPNGFYKVSFSPAQANSSDFDTGWLDSNFTEQHFSNSNSYPVFTVLVPEPAGLAAFGLALLALGRRCRRSVA